MTEAPKCVFCGDSGPLVEGACAPCVRQAIAVYLVTMMDLGWRIDPETERLHYAPQEETDTV